MAKQTAAERRAQVLQKAHDDLVVWNGTKCNRLIWAMARAQMLGLDTILQVKNDGIHIRIQTPDLDTCHDHYLSELNEWEMQCIEQDLSNKEQERARQVRLRQVREQVLSTLTDEQKEALGLL